MRLYTPDEEDYKTRLEVWETWLSNFEKQNLDEHGNPVFVYIPKAAWLLNDLYWHIVEQYLRPLLLVEDEEENHRINQYKIISASEITVMMTLPIEVSGTELEQRKWNAFLAYFISLQLLEGWNAGENNFPVTASDIGIVSDYKEYFDSSQRYPESFAAEHIQWLTHLNVTVEKPFLLNAQCWRLFYISCLAVNQKGELK